MTKRSLTFRLMRAIVIAAILVIAALLGYVLWQPGHIVTDGRHDRGTNGIWLGHGWLGDDAWFTRNDRDPALFRDPTAIAALVDQLKAHHIVDLFPHLCPCSPRGDLAPWDAAQVERFLDTPSMSDMRVMPWIGGPLDQAARPDDPQWRQRFIASAVQLLASHPRLAGVHVNIEPLPSGHPGFLTLLTELKAALPPTKILSVAAYPPPTIWQPVPDVHWSEPYFRQVAARADHLAVMMYDTAIRFPKLYQHTLSQWTREVLQWSNGTPTLLGLPAYEDTGVGYHHPHVENLRIALSGVHAGLLQHASLPPHYRGVTIYAHWTMDDAEWRRLREQFLTADE